MEAATETGSNENDVEQSESYLFREEAEFFQCIDLLLPSNDQNDTTLSPSVSSETNDGATSATNDGATSATSERALASIRSILDKYLECPTLLDSSLKAMVDKLVSQVKGNLLRTQTIGGVEHQNKLIQYPLTALYAIAKVRGYKYVTAFFSHMVEDVDLIWNALIAWREEHGESTDCWEPLYTLWHWMGILSLVPFSTQVMSGEQGLVEKIVHTAKSELEQQTGPVQEAAATCLAAWLSRPDTNLIEFARWSQKVIHDYVVVLQHGSASSTTTMTSRSLTLILGVLQALTKILKHTSATRQIVIEQLVEPLWEPLLILANDPRTSGNLLLHRYLVKWWTRTSCAYFPPTRACAPWRYQRGRRMLLMDEQQQQPNDRKTATTESNEAYRESTFVQQNETDSAVILNDCDDDLFFVPDQVEDAMGRILEALGHSSTRVRWSAAKGVGRVTERLPELCAQDVLDAVLEYFEYPEKDNCWHGACLALAELARKGLLLPASLSEVVREIIKAIHYDVKRGHSSVGSNVRDAACYAFWAFARSYSPEVLRGHLDKLAEAVVMTSLFDREVNCRRAASAAFQEAVGRQGMASFTNGIFVVTTADFYSLGNRSEAYTSIAAKIAHLDEYRRPIMEHLYQNKLFHWDPVIRQLSAQGLASVAPLDPSFIGENAIPFLLERSLDCKNLHVRHGAVMGVGELVRVLGADCGVLQANVSAKTLDKMLDLVNQIEKHRLYRGRGGEMMRVAVCRLVECISLVRIPLDVKRQVQMLDAVDASIPHPNEEIQQCACTALEQLFTAYFPVGEKGPTDRLRTRVLEKFLNMVDTSKNPAATRGYTLALGYLPDRLLAPTTASLDGVIKTLSAASNPKAKVEGEGDAETRRNALKSLARVLSTVARSTLILKEIKKFPVQPLTAEQCSMAIKALFLSLEDYNVDRRGDVGSWCRMAAMEGLSSVVLLCHQLPDYAKLVFAPLDGTRFVGILIKQLAERLDAVRICAGSCLKKVLLQKDADFPAFVGKTRLVAVLDLESSAMIDYNWADPEAVFARVMAAALVHDNPTEGEQTLYPYYEYAIAGIIASVGGKAESAHATRAFLSHAKEAKNTEVISLLGNTLLALFERYKGVGRVTLPLLRSMEKLLARRCFDDLLLDNEKDYASSLQRQVESEFAGCRDMDRLIALANISSALINALPTGSRHKRESLKFLCRMLNHRYPKLRSHAAEIVYMIIIEEDHSNAAPGKSDSAITLILETPWGSDLSEGEVQQSAKDVKKSLGFSDEQIAVPDS
ncbi:hypothetical protein ACA910_019918 [Epithemia clementina (nom. ined.)]